MTEYAAVRNGGAGVIDLSVRGRIVVSGSEVVMFLNGLITNDMKTLAVNSWMPAVFPNVQGRLLAAVRVIHRDDGFLIDTEGATHDTVLKLLERFTLAGDFRVTDVTGETAMLSLQGRQAAEIIRTTLGEEAAHVERQQVVSAQLERGTAVTVIRTSHTAEDGFDLFVSNSGTQALSGAFTAAGAKPLSASAWETLRIEAGVAHSGIDMDETNVVTETNLDDAVSFSKGCYTGQEMVARAKFRGANKRALYWLEGKAGRVPQPAEDLELQLGENWRRTGTVLSAAKLADGTLWVQVVLNNDLEADSKLRVRDDATSELAIRPLPYSLEA